MQRRLLAGLAFLLLAGACCSVANAQLTLDAVFDQSDTADFPGSTPIATSTNATAAATIEATIDSALAQVTSDVTCSSPLTLSIEFESDPNIGLGASSFGVEDLSYTSYLSYLTANLNKSSNDITALASMPVGPGTGINNNATDVQLGGPLLDAIGDTTDGNFVISGNGGFAGTVALNLSQMNISRTNPNSNDYDLEATVLHEVDEVLGIGGAGSTLHQGAGPAATDIGALDLFRYGSVGNRSYSTSENVSSYFSINGGATDLVYFNQFKGGDFGDWGDGVTPADNGTPTPMQVQDAFAPPDTEVNLGPDELTAFDVVGWNLTAEGMSVDGIPEPGSAWLFAAGLGALGFAQRRRMLLPR